MYFIKKSETIKENDLKETKTNNGTQNQTQFH